MRIFIILLAIALPSIVAAGDLDWPVIRPSLEWPEIKPSLKVAVVSKPEAVMVSKNGHCPGCLKMEKDTKDWKESPVTFKKVIEGKHPVETDGYPTIYWKGADGNWWTYSGWYGREHFLREYTISQTPQKKSTATYPTRGGNWTGPDGYDFSTKEDAIRHLIEDGVHVGRFSRSILQALTLEQLRALHSDDHENRVQWNHLNKGK